MVKGDSADMALSGTQTRAFCRSRPKQPTKTADQNSRPKQSAKTAA
jgi:hypothetical protein